MARWIIALFIATLTLWPVFAVAQTHKLGSLPRRSAKVGFTMSVRIDPVGGYGYHPFYLDFLPSGAQFNRDRQLQVRIRPRDSRSTLLDFECSTPVLLPQGSPGESVTVLVPEYYRWDSFQVSIHEDGQLVETGSTTMSIGRNICRYSKQLTSVGIITPSDDGQQDAAWKEFPDVRTLVTVLGEGPLPEDAKSLKLNLSQAKRVVRQVQPAWVQFRLLPELGLHNTWLGYSQLDVIIVAEPVLQRIESQSPQAYQALLDWIVAGGNLWVHHPTTEPSTLLRQVNPQHPVASQLLPANSVKSVIDPTGDNDTSDLAYDSWNEVQKQSSHYNYSRQNKPFKQRGDVFQELKAAGHAFANVVPQADLAKQMRIGKYGAGRVLVLDSEEPFPGSFQFWVSAGLVTSHEQLRWIDRNGVDIAAGNESYWSWLIPSVGRPPVRTFLIVNTLFVIVIGPLCYFVLRRYHRLYLLYFFAPALALLVTTSLFAYALAVDGTRTKTRIRQISWIDPSGGSVLEQSRQTYYSVFGTDDLRFPADVLVSPLVNRPIRDRYRSRSSSAAGQGSVRWSEEHQWFGGSFLPPRDQAQYLVTRPRRLNAEFGFSFKSDHAELNNGFGVSIERFVVRDRNRRFFVGENIPKGGVGRLELRGSFDIRAWLNDSVLPSAYHAPELSRQRWSTIGVAGTHSTLLEAKLEGWSRDMPPGTFVGFAPIGDQVLAVDDATVIDSVHVIAGELP